MQGSKKQIKWATDIQTKMAKEAENYLGKKATYDILINKILGIDYSEFWIDYRDYSLQHLLQSLPTTGLRTKGLGFSNTLKADRETLQLTESWDEIVSDGKGGHKITKTKIW